MSLEPGDRFGRYRIVATLGAGGMGEVYRARDSRNGREVALKLLPRHLLNERRALMRFEREARAIALLRHENVVTLYDVGTHEGMPYVVIELLDGETLSARLERDGALPWREAARIGAAVARGLAAAHERGIIHRDVKPENVFLTREDRVKLLDFGVARFDPDLSELERQQTSERWTQTAAGHVIGTLAYMAPEQLNGGRSDARSDLFAVGCVLYQMLDGRHPFHRASFVDTVMAVARERPVPLAERGRALPAELERLVLACLSRDPALRPAGAAAVASILTGIGAGDPPPSPSPSPSAGLSRRRLGPAAALAAPVLALAAGLGWWLGTWHAAPSAVAVLPLGNLAPSSEVAWIGKALAERLAVELDPERVDPDPGVRPLPGGEVERVMAALALTAGERPGRETLARLRARLAADYVVTGTYWAEGEPGGRRLRVDLWLEDAARRETVTGLSEEGTVSELPALARNLGERLRAHLPRAETPPVAR